MAAFIHRHRDRFGVEPICRLLPIAAATYYATKRRPPSARQLCAAELKPEIMRLQGELLLLRSPQGLAATEERRLPGGSLHEVGRTLSR